ncbi:hypothetical protein JOE50_002664 [Bradyrhizobium japonicum]|nr:hypothetical protein [Bradyrhizobium japonicum]
MTGLKPKEDNMQISIAFNRVAAVDGAGFASSG